eukprot:TRINITY_DN1596_c0_g1_i1.p1 TRINITY_DN1596_c0_g1~~TRINITY_DN1596_c0_g1_i1.p1  ORF type:complete len:487 (+),score=155.70 TRINITY_DN1596_c0_g1_i1:64-1524(+)
MLPTKISLRDDIRKLTLPQNMVYIDLRNHAAKIFEIKHQHFLLQYQDEEGDFISLTNDEEWRDALQMAHAHQKLRLRIMLENENPVHNIGLSRAEHVNIGVTSMMKSIPQDKLHQMISSVLTSPDTQKMLQQCLISTLPHLNSPVKPANNSNTKPNPPQNTNTNTAAVQPQAPKIVNNQQTNNNVKPVETTTANNQNGGMYPPPPLLSSLGMYPNAYAQNKPASQGMYPVVPPYSGYGSQLYASTTSYSRLDDDKRPLAAFVRDVACFEGTKIQPKTLFFKTWRLQNNGKYAWPAQTKLVWEGGDSFGYKVESEVLQANPGNTVDATVHLESPNIPGRYNSCWRLCSNGEKFGPRVWVDISVVDPQHMYPALQTNQQAATNVPPSSSHPLPTTNVAVNQPIQPVIEIRKMGEVSNSNDTSNSITQSVSLSESQQTGKSSKSMETGLQQLEDMGFKNREANTKLMLEHNGEVLQVVQALLCQEIIKE